MFEVKVRFTCDNAECRKTEELYCELSIDEDTEWDSVGGTRTEYSLAVNTIPEGWITFRRYSSELLYCSNVCRAQIHGKSR